MVKIFAAAPTDGNLGDAKANACTASKDAYFAIPITVTSSAQTLCTKGVLNK